MKILTRHSDTK